MVLKIVCFRGMRRNDGKLSDQVHQESRFQLNVDSSGTEAELKIEFWEDSAQSTLHTAGHLM